MSLAGERFLQEGLKVVISSAEGTRAKKWKKQCCVPLQNLKCHPKMVTGIQIPQQGLSRKVHLDQD